MRDQETDRHPSLNEGDHKDAIKAIEAINVGLNHPSLNEGDHRCLAMMLKKGACLNHPSLNEGDHRSATTFTLVAKIRSQSPFTE